MKLKKDNDLAFEDAIGNDWEKDADIAEVPINNTPMLWLGLVIVVIACAIFGRVIFLNMNGAYYEARAQNNISQSDATPAPRGLIYDRNGDILAENKAAFAAVLDAQAFLAEDQGDQSSTLSSIDNILGLSPAAVTALVQQSAAQDFATPVVLVENLDQNALVNLQALNDPAIQIRSDFERTYPNGPIFSSILGYTGRVSQANLQADPGLKNQDFIGKAGIEAFYDQALRGTAGVTMTYKNAQGQSLNEQEQSTPQIGAPLTLTIDGGLQTELYNAMAAGLSSLNRTIGLGLAINPQNGQILALVNLPSYDNNVFSTPGASSSIALIKNLLTSPDDPLFDNVVAGNFNPGSTIKPLDAVAGLKEGVVTPTREVFSPGYLLIPNPYNSSTPTRAADWQYQGNVDLATALAQSSDVYFYLVGGGSPISTPMLNDPSDYGISGLGITKLHDWWQTFGLGKPTGIDLPGEGSGFLPTPTWKQEKLGTSWLLGDTYNVSIGQGDLLVTPLQLLSYIDAIANGGEIYRPYLDASSTPQVNEDLTYLLPQIEQVQVGMWDGVNYPRGTSYTLHDLPFSICAKTGSAQVHDNSQENALFVGYAPCTLSPDVAGMGAGTVPPTSAAYNQVPQIALLILIEDSKQGSLNAVPIAKQVLNWYYSNRIQNSESRNQ